MHKVINMGVVSASTLLFAFPANAQVQKQVEQRLAQWNQQQFPQGFVQIDGEEIPAHWKVYDIWLRENGIININYGYDYLSSNGNGGGGRRYDTFLIEQETARLMDSGEGIYRVSAHE